jgi:YjbE family integral membrane protein
VFSYDLLSVELAALAQVLFINVVLSGDNAIVVGMAAANVDVSIRRKVIFWGIGGAVVLRIGFAIVTTRLLDIVGLRLAGGVLLLWVCWKMFREIRGDRKEDGRSEAGAAQSVDLASCGAETMVPGKTFPQAIVQIVVADLSMSLDNVLAVAGAAREHVAILIIGLLLSVAMMGTAATLIARLLDRFRWIAWVGLSVILWVAVDMVHRGSIEVCGGLTGTTCRIGELAFLIAR